MPRLSRISRLLALVPVLLATACATARREPAVPAMLTREAWGARAPVLPMRAHEVSRITIHHTATPQQPGRTLEEKLRALQRFSQEESPLADGRVKAAWADIPYHYYVDHAGRVGEGREVGYAGDTNTSYDPTGHLLIVLEGNFEVEQPTPAQWATLQRLVSAFAARYGVSAERLDGHRDHASTLCPGRHLYERLPQLRAMLPGARGER